MKIFKIIQTPIVKITGICLVLYFGLFANKENPASLGNRLSPDNIKKNVSEATKQVKFISTNLREAKEVIKQREAQQKSLQNNPQILAQETGKNFEDIAQGAGQDASACGDTALISYGVYTSDEKQIDFVASEEILIGKNPDSFIGKNIIAMKQQGIRNIKAFQGQNYSDKKVMKLLEKEKQDLIYKVILVNLKKSPENNSKFCK